jgi:glycosyltransferase involved in cell wall biosynthesis
MNAFPARLPRPLLARLLVGSPGLSEERRYRLARRLVRDLLRDGDLAGARGIGLRALRRIRRPRFRADLLGDVVNWSLAHGRPTALAKDAYAAELVVADRHLAKQRYRAAAESFAEAMRIASHRVLHFDSLTSPLADDPTGFSAPLRTSSVAAALRAPRGRVGAQAVIEAGRVDAKAVPGTERTQLLIATRINADFLGEIREHFGNSPDFDATFVDFGTVHELDRFAKSPEKIAFQTLARRPTLAALAEAAFRRHLDRSDVVLVEWCTALAALLTQVDPRDTRVVVRMHSYEAFTVWPHLMDFSRIDDVVFVSDHLRDLAVAAIPGLRGPNAPRLHVIPNAMDLRPFLRPKVDDARFTLGVVGASKMVKDPRWAIEVLRHLRRHDDRYRLVLIRGKLQDPSQAARAYAEDLRRDLEELEPCGAVEVLGHTDDVPAALEDIGIVVSSSVRESFHMGLVEGAASGAVPVVRNWPFFPGAAARLFPPDWVVDTPEQAAERILAVNQTAEGWHAASEEASRYVIDRWDWQVVQRDFDRLLGQGRSEA